MADPFIVQVDWSAEDGMFAAVLLRDGQPWYLSGALVGMGITRPAAIEDLEGIARHLVTEGGNGLLSGPLPLADREWLFGVLDAGGDGAARTAMYAALAAARREAARAAN